MKRPMNYVATAGLSWGVALALLAALVWYGEPWRIAANTRFLDLLIEGGIVRYHDGHMGLLDGIPVIEDYVRSQELIDWRLVGLVFALYVAWFALKAWQFHGIGRFVGLKGSPGQHARAWVYGDGLGRLLPFRFGDCATASLLEAQGEDPRAGLRALRTGDVLVLLFEIGLFTVWGLFVNGWALWFFQNVPPLVIVLCSAWVCSLAGIVPYSWSDLVDTVKDLAKQPGTFARLGAISALAMLLDDMAPFFVALAFNTDAVVIHTPFLIIQAGVCAGYIARRFPVTPGGIGMHEWAFVLALQASGVAVPDAVTIALLDSLIRNGTGALFFLSVTLRYGTETSFDAVLGRYLGRDDASVRVEPLRPVGAIA